MISPIERAAEALVNAAFGQELPEAPIDLAKAVLSSIDTDELADVLRRATDNGADRTEEYALAVKNWLTGKDQQ